MRNLIFATGLALCCAACTDTSPPYAHQPYAYQPYAYQPYAYQDAYQPYYDPWLWGPPLGLGAGGFVFLNRHHHDEDAPFDPHHPSFNRHEGFQQARPTAPHPMAGPPPPRTSMGQRPIAPHPGGPAPWITQQNRNGG